MQLLLEHYILSGYTLNSSNETDRVLLEQYRPKIGGLCMTRGLAQ